MKKKKTVIYWGIGLLCLFLLGCAKKGIIVETDDVVTGSEVEESEVESVSEREDNEHKAIEEVVDADVADDGTVEDSFAKEQEEIQEAKTLWVHISGEVIRPGVYELNDGARIWEAIEAAGGVTEEGAGDYLNQAQPLMDGMKVIVPSLTQVEEWEKRGEPQELVVAMQSSDNQTVAPQQETDSRIDINTADEAALCTLPGIGESRARSIIAYRQENGGFARIEDIMKISGIKEAAFNKIKDLIKVSGE